VVDIVIRKAEECAPDSYTLWDSVWSPADGFADWQLSNGSEPYNHGGLQSSGGISTAVILALFTDKRITPDHPLYFLADGDPRGWWGDAVDVRADLHEGDLGSYLWLLERSPLTIAGLSAAYWARLFALEALAPLQSQGVVARIEVEATANELRERLELVVRLYGRTGSSVFDQRFNVLWNQVR
jgi:phage gp46-like protein